MKTEYEEFKRELIEHAAKNYSSRPFDIELVRNRCVEFTIKFVDKFPELKRVSGFYEIDCWRREHWWLVDEKGNIIDPTVEQFKSGGTYIEFDETIHEIYLGKCGDCGEEVYGLKSKGFNGFCSEQCQTAYYSWVEKEANKKIW